MNLFLKTSFSVFLSIVFSVCFYTISAAQQPPAPDNSTINLCHNLPFTEFAKQQFASDKVNNLYLIKNEKFINSINLKTGEVNWTFDTGGALLPRLIADEDYLYVSNFVTPKKGNEMKGNETKGNEASEIGASETNVETLVFRAVSRQSGLTVWKTVVEINAASTRPDTNKSDSDKTDSKDVFSTDVFSGSYLAETDDAILFGANSCFGRLNKSNGGIEWKKCVAASPVSNFVSNNSKNFLGFNDDKHIYLLETRNGDVKLKIPVETKISALALIDDSTLIYGDKKGNVKFLENEGGKTVWTVKVGGEISGIALSGRNLLVSSLDNFVYLLDGNKGRTIWKKRFPGRVRDKPLVKDNTAVIVGGDSDAFFVNTADGKVFYRISLPQNVYFLKSTLFVNDYYFFLTDTGVLAYSDGFCQKNEKKTKAERRRADPLLIEKV